MRGIEPLQGKASLLHKRRSPIAPHRKECNVAEREGEREAKLLTEKRLSRYHPERSDFRKIGRDGIFWNVVDAKAGTPRVPRPHPHQARCSYLLASKCHKLDV